MLGGVAFYIYMSLAREKSHVLYIFFRLYDPQSNICRYHTTLLCFHERLFVTQMLKFIVIYYVMKESGGACCDSDFRYSRTTVFHYY